LILGSAVHAQRVLFTNRHGKERIEPQKIMIVKILVAGWQAKQALGHQLAYITNTRRVSKNPPAALGGTVEVHRHRATKSSMSSN